MKKLFILTLTLLITSSAWSAQQPLSTITTKNSREALRTAVNTEFGKVQSNTTELYNLAIAAPWLAQGTAPSIHNVFWVDTSGTSPVIKYWDGDSWEVAAAGEGGTYTLPTASAETKGGVKIGARLTMTGEVLSADVQTTDISGKENSLGNPSVNGYVLSSTTGGTRSWIEMTGGVAGISHATSDGNPYASRNGAWYSLAGLYAAALGTDDNYVTDAEKAALSTYALKSNVLELNRTTAFTPDADYEPATKKYVDDSIVAGGSYTDEQAQDAVGSMFSGNTVTGITTTYDDTGAKINAVVDTQIPGVTSSGITGTLTLAKTGTTARTATFQDAAGTVAYTSDIVAAPTDATITTTDVTTNNASTSKHGWLLKATAPASGLRNVVAIDNGETAYTNKALFDTTSPSTQAFGDAAAVGTSLSVARRDHKHAMPAAPTTITGNAGTATALAANGGNCTAGQAALGVDASGAAEGCWTPSGSFDPASPGAIGGTTPSAGTFTTIGAGAGGFTVDADGDLIAKSIGTTRSATIGSIFDLYEGSNNGDNKVTIQPSAALSVDKTIVAENILQTTDVDDTPVNGETAPVSSNWAYDHVAASDPHTGYLKESSLGTSVEAALGVNIGSTGAPVLFNGAGGTPTSLALTNALLANSTSLPGTCTVGQVYQDTDADTDGDVYFCRATNTWKAIDDDGGAGGLATTDIDTSAELRAILGDEVGTGAAYFVGGALGTPASATLTNATGLPISGTTGWGTNVAAALANTLGGAGGVTTTIASGTSALGTGAITSGECATVVTTTATNTATTDVINWGFNGDPTGVTGYAPSANGMLTIIAYPSAGNVNYKVCNNTAASITPGAITLNWRVQR